IRGTVAFEAEEGESLAEYVHPPANKIGVLVKYHGGSPELARKLAMHISFAAPRFTSRDDVPEEELDGERAIFAKQPEVEGKPEEVQAKIVEGMLQKRFFAEAVLLDQTWIHDPSMTVGAALAEEGLEVVEFERFALAE